MRFARPQVLHLGVLTMAVAACLATRPALGHQGHVVPTAAITWSAGAASGTGMLIWHGCAVLLEFLQPAAQALALAPSVAPTTEFSTSVRHVAHRLHARWRHSARSSEVAIRAPVAAPRVHPPPMVATYRPLLDPRVGIAAPERPGIGHLLDVRCDACVRSAAGAATGETTILPNSLDLQALTIIQVGGASVKLTSLQPFSLLFKKHF